MDSGQDDLWRNSTSVEDGKKKYCKDMNKEHMF